MRANLVHMDLIILLMYVSYLCIYFPIYSSNHPTQQTNASKSSDFYDEAHPPSLKDILKFVSP
jgi:hypothetical protein